MNVTGNELISPIIFSFIILLNVFIFPLGFSKIISFDYKVHIRLVLRSSLNYLADKIKLTETCMIFGIQKLALYQGIKFQGVKPYLKKRWLQLKKNIQKV